jgi:hypothetical protein
VTGKCPVSPALESGELHYDEDWALNGLILRKNSVVDQGKNIVGDFSSKSRTLYQESPMSPSNDPRLLGYLNAESYASNSIENYSEKDNKCSCRFLSV